MYQKSPGENYSPGLDVFGIVSAGADDRIVPKEFFVAGATVDDPFFVHVGTGIDFHGFAAGIAVDGFLGAASGQAQKEQGGKQQAKQCFSHTLSPLFFGAFAPESEGAQTLWLRLLWFIIV